MSVADLQLPTRLLAGGGPSPPDPRVLRALTTPVVGQFDPAFTAVMDDVVRLARMAFLTSNARCFALSALPSAGVEAVLNSVLEPGAEVAIAGGPTFVVDVADVARRMDLRVVPLDTITSSTDLVVTSAADAARGTRIDVREIVQHCHARGARVLLDATLALGACELRVDDWSIDACVAGVDYALGAPSGMTLVTYSPVVEAQLAARQSLPGTSYLDLLQLQAYWSPERLNHHTAPTTLVYGLREALRLVQEEGLERRWERHARCGRLLRDGLVALGLEPSGDLPVSIVHLPPRHDEPKLRTALLEDFGIHVTRIGPRVWRLGLLGDQARPEHVHRLLASLEKVLTLR